MANKKYKQLIKKGLFSPLHKVPFHAKAPLKRYLMQDHGTFPHLKKITPGSNYHIAAHIINKLPGKIPEYCDAHAHNCDEINLILSENGKLVYDVILDDEKYVVSSPATIYIPKGVRHKVQVKSGHGIFIAIVMSKEYRASLILPPKTPPLKNRGCK